MTDYYVSKPEPILEKQKVEHHIDIIDNDNQNCLDKKL